MCDTTSTYVESAVATAVHTWTPRPPPNSRAISTTTTTVAMPSRVAATRRPVGVSPNTAVDARASHGVIGGWSTYPQAGRLPAARKYSSSRWKPYRPDNSVSTTAWRATTRPTGTAAKRGNDPETRPAPMAVSPRRPRIVRS